MTHAFLHLACPSGACCHGVCCGSIAYLIPAGLAAQNEMCNMYMMVTSEIPYFLACGNRQARSHTVSLAA